MLMYMVAKSRSVQFGSCRKIYYLFFWSRPGDEMRMGSDSSAVAIVMEQGCENTGFGSNLVHSSLYYEVSERGSYDLVFQQSETSLVENNVHSFLYPYHDLDARRVNLVPRQ